MPPREASPLADVAAIDAFLGDDSSEQAAVIGYFDEEADEEIPDAIDHA